MELRIIENGTGLLDGGCGSQSGSGCAQGHIPHAIQKRIHDHPCYSDDAHRTHARMHLAVAPGCNIQCNYCNRKFDCVNESRPGVVSEVLKPQEAVRKALAVAARIPNLSVVGIAGPGDPLANPKRTFETLRGVRQALPHVKLCLSTNGLMLARHAETIRELGIDHVTITMNTIDPDVAAKIYPWVIWEGRRIKGREGAEILIREQLRGLEAMTARGCLVKINTVLIPGVNDESLGDVSRAVRARGAFLHNVMPLISRAEHGTAFGLAGQAEPTEADLRAAQETCGVDMRLMRHCRRCRADAIGMLDEDRSAEFTMDKVAVMEKAADGFRIAVASRDGTLIDQHFGHAKAFRLFDVTPSGITPAGVRDVAAYCNGPAECDEDEGRLDRTMAALKDCAVVVCARIGRDPRLALEAEGIRVNADYAWHGVDEALQTIAGALNETPARAEAVA